MPRARDKGKAIHRVAMLLPRQFVNYIKDERENGFLTQEELGLCLDLLIECFLADELPSNEALRDKYGNQWVRFCLPAVHEMRQSKKTYVNQYTPSQPTDVDTEVDTEEVPCREVEVHAGTCREVEVHAEGNIIYNNNNDNDNNKGKYKNTDNKLPPEGVDNAVWVEWVAYRKKLKATVSTTVVNSLTKEGEKAGLTLQQVLVTCLTNGWRGFQAEWVLKGKPKEALGSNGLPLSHASNINEKHQEAKDGDYTQDDWDRLMKTGKYAPK